MTNINEAASQTKPKIEAPCGICGKVIRATTKSGLNLGMTAHMRKHKAKIETEPQIRPKVEVTIGPPEDIHKTEALAPDMATILNHPLVQSVLSKVGALEATIAQLTENNYKMTEAMSALVKSNNAMQEELTPIVQAVHSAQSQQPPQQSPNQSILGFSLSPEIQKTLADALIKRLLGGGSDSQVNMEALTKQIAQQSAMMTALQESANKPVILAMQNLTARAKFYAGIGLDQKQQMQALEADAQGGVK